MTEAWQLAYVSLDAGTSEDEFDALMRFSQTRNRRSAIGGFLLRLGDTIFQVMEGPPERVKSLFYERIACDPRHGDVQVVLERPVERVAFRGWGMVRLQAMPRVLTTLWGGVLPPQGFYRALIDDPALAEGVIRAGALLHDLAVRQGAEIVAGPHVPPLTCAGPDIPGLGPVRLGV